MRGHPSRQHTGISASEAIGIRNRLPWLGRETIGSMTKDKGRRRASRSAGGDKPRTDLDELDVGGHNVCAFVVVGYWVGPVALLHLLAQVLQHLDRDRLLSRPATEFRVVKGNTPKSTFSSAERLGRLVLAYGAELETLHQEVVRLPST
jgi:hypothetical protein